mmetsp:Transcript_50771/g.127393  ORF Transcript_50771/g.127393 Transcript_50771/m.127393 type:complete len:203 (+) Transcript_50771:627-1235(+)
MDKFSFAHDDHENPRSSGNAQADTARGHYHQPAVDDADFAPPHRPSGATGRDRPQPAPPARRADHLRAPPRRQGGQHLAAHPAFPALPVPPAARAHVQIRECPAAVGARGNGWAALDPHAVRSWPRRSHLPQVAGAHWQRHATHAHSRHPSVAHWPCDIPWRAALLGHPAVPAHHDRDGDAPRQRPNPNRTHKLHSEAAWLP